MPSSTHLPAHFKRKIHGLESTGLSTCPSTPLPPPPSLFPSFPFVYVFRPACLHSPDGGVLQKVAGSARDTQLSGSQDWCNTAAKLWMPLWTGHRSGRRRKNSLLGFSRAPPGLHKSVEAFNVVRKQLQLKTYSFTSSAN